jgi:hypothetical protein
MQRARIIKELRVEKKKEWGRSTPYSEAIATGPMTSHQKRDHRKPAPASPRNTTDAHFSAASSRHLSDISPLD